MPVPRPQLDAWQAAFLLRARLLDLPGPRIGEALAEVEAHCAQSGESPEEAFGNAADYAEALAAAGARPGPRRRRWSWLAWISTASGGAAAALALGVIALAEGRSRETVDVGVLGFLLGCVLIWPTGAAVLRMRRREGRVAVVGVAVVAWLAIVLWGRPALTLPVPALLGIGAGLAGLLAVPFAIGRVRTDRVVDPRTGLELDVLASMSPGDRRRLLAIAAGAVVALLGVLTLLAVLR